MTATVAAAPARLRMTTSDRRWWTCVCGKTLGEIVGDRVIIKVQARTIIASIDAPIEQTCSCGRTVVLVSEAVN